MRIALLGKSGSGKSTLLNLIAGLDRATAGNVVVEGQDLHRMHCAELARYRCRVVGMIFQSFNLLPSRTAGISQVRPRTSWCRARRPRGFSSATRTGRPGESARRSCWWTVRRTCGQSFLIEGALIGLVGGTARLLLAWAASFPADAWVRALVWRDLKIKLAESVFFPAWRAARINPVTALRTE